MADYIDDDNDEPVLVDVGLCRLGTAHCTNPALPGELCRMHAQPPDPDNTGERARPRGETDWDYRQPVRDRAADAAWSTNRWLNDDFASMSSQELHDHPENR